MPDLTTLTDEKRHVVECLKRIRIDIWAKYQRSLARTEELKLTVESVDVALKEVECADE